MIDHFGKTGTLGNQADSQVVSIGGLFSSLACIEVRGDWQIENEAVALAQEKEVKRM